MSRNAADKDPEVAFEVVVVVVEQLDYKIVCVKVTASVANQYISHKSISHIFAFMLCSDSADSRDFLQICATSRQQAGRALEHYSFLHSSHFASLCRHPCNDTSSGQGAATSHWTHGISWRLLHLGTDVTEKVERRQRSLRSSCSSSHQSW